MAFALTPGLPPLDRITIKPFGDSAGRLMFTPQARARVLWVGVGEGGCWVGVGALGG